MRNPFDNVTQQLAAIDVRVISDALRALPKIVESLETLVVSVGELNDEVRAMHADVVELQGHVDAVTGSTAPLAGKLDRLHEDVVGMGTDVASMSAGVGEMVPLIEDLSGTMHPFRRVFGRRGRGEDAIEDAVQDIDGEGAPLPGGAPDGNSDAGEAEGESREKAGADAAPRAQAEAGPGPRAEDEPRS